MVLANILSNRAGSTRKLSVDADTQLSEAVVVQEI